MRLVKLSIKNYRSIKGLIGVRVEQLQGFVGENNSGKSNILKALNCFLISGSGGIQPSDFNNQETPIIIEAEFSSISENERRKLRQYLIGDKLILQKQFFIQDDPKAEKQKIATEYHGYLAEPRDWWLSIAKIEERGGPAGKRTPEWRKIAENNGLLEYVLTEDGKVTKTSYRTGLERFLNDHNEVEYDQPVLGNTKALGIQQNLLSTLPDFFLLPAITDYSDEIDRRSSSTVFRRLMGDLSDRIIKADPRYIEIEEALNTLKQLLNFSPADEGVVRLDAISSIETALADTIAKLMPTVQGVRLEVSVEEPKELFSRGVSLRIDDGVMTDVLSKGHGLQRSVVFGLLQMLMKTIREASGNDAQRPIILAIEEPELYIHPQSQRLIFNVLKDFAGVKGDTPVGDDQVLYTTHSPAFIDLSNYERIGVVRKNNLVDGTTVKQCEEGILGTIDEKKGFKIITSFGLKHNELFFAREVIIVEGVEDEVGIIATARKLGRINELPDEIGLSIVVSDGKGEIPKFQKVLNAFGFNYGVLLELDGKPETENESFAIIQNLNGNRIFKVQNRLEDLLGIGRHFNDQRHAKIFFSEPRNINADMERLVQTLLPPI